MVFEASPIGSQPSVGVGEDVHSMDEFLEDDLEDLETEDDVEVDEDEMWGWWKLNSVATISSLRMKPSSSSRFFIPLCRMIAMPMVRPTLPSDLAKQEQEFVHGYPEGAAVFYFS